MSSLSGVCLIANLSQNEKLSKGNLSNILLSFSTNVDLADL